MEKIAREIKEFGGKKSWTGNAKLFKLDPPLKGKIGVTTEYIVVSTWMKGNTGILFGVFKVDEYGYGNMGSYFKDSGEEQDYEKILEGIGYTLVGRKSIIKLSKEGHLCACEFNKLLLSGCKCGGV